MSDLKKLDSFTLEMSKNHLIRTFLRNGRLRVKKNNTKKNFQKLILVPNKKIERSWYRTHDLEIKNLKNRLKLGL